MSTMNTLIADLEAIPLADMTERDQLTFAAAIGHLRRLSDRVHRLEIGQHRTAEKIDELERENARMRAALEEIAKQVPAKDIDEDYYEAADFEDGYDRCVFQARAALAGSGEK